ncbi:MAG: 16S rRNA (guanine(527)-N(7))-methyltransferase RsmG [Chloroflexi bacterium]|nr:16S rRNA (guanine(527)-N(7))-methyltransferase RsmG [Chloroflexota bacterium]
MSETDARAARVALEQLLEGRSLDLPPSFGDRVERFVGLLLDANRRLNLTRVVEPGAVARLHLLDSLAGLPAIDALAPSSAVDLGSGGGVPGMVLALARPEVAWTLVDSVAKKTDALRAFAVDLRLANVSVITARAEDLGRDPAHRATHGLVTARAVAALPVLVEYALPLLTGGGALRAWKGPIAPSELRAGAAASAELGGGAPRVEPSGHAALGDHRLVIVRRERPTPARYPRRAGEPSRRPLGG